MKSHDPNCFEYVERLWWKIWQRHRFLKRNCKTFFLSTPRKAKVVYELSAHGL